MSGAREKLGETDGDTLPPATPIRNGSFPPPHRSTRSSIGVAYPVRSTCDRLPLPTEQFFASIALKYESRSARAVGDPGGGVVANTLDVAPPDREGEQGLESDIVAASRRSLAVPAEECRGRRGRETKKGFAWSDESASKSSV